MKWLATILCLWTAAGQAATTNVAVSGSWTDVSNALYSARSDPHSVLMIPTGSNNYAGTLQVTNGVTIIGGWNGSATAAGTNKDGTILTCSGCSGFIFDLSPGLGKTSRVTNIRFETANRVFNIAGINTNSQRVRIDHCLITNCTQHFFENRGALAVLDHNSIWGDHQVPIGYVYHANFDGTSVYSAGSQSASNYYGTDKFLIFESNFVTNTLPANHVTGIDGYGGGRCMARYNIFGKVSMEGHGLESGRSRGFRCWVINNNTFRGNNSGDNVIYVRSGTGLVYSNDVLGYFGVAAVLKLVYDSDSYGYPPWAIGNAERQGCDGRNTWDTNLASGPFTTGTATAGGSQQVVNSIFVTNTSAPWSTDQWRGYAINRTSGIGVSSLTRSGTTVTVDTSSAHGFSTGWRVSVRGADQPVYNVSGQSITVVDSDTFTYELDFAAGTPASPATGSIYCFRGHGACVILGNTPSVIEYKVSGQTIDTGNNYYDLQFTNGTTFSVYKAVHGMDQPGRVMGSLIGDSDPPSLPAGWNDQVTSQWCQWSNTFESGTLTFSHSGFPNIVPGVHSTNNFAPAGYTPYPFPAQLIADTDAMIASAGDMGVTGTAARAGNRGKGHAKR